MSVLSTLPAYAHADGYDPFALESIHVCPSYTSHRRALCSLIWDRVRGPFARCSDRHAERVFVWNSLRGHISGLAQERQSTVSVFFSLILSLDLGEG